jgi:high affinity sulfate transporter 1
MFTLLRGYRLAWLRGDLLAGVTVAAICIPESLGYATIAGLPVQTGLYCALLPAMLFALIASSRQLVVGADSATAALVAAGAGMVATSGSAEYGGAVAVLGLLTAAFLLLMGVARLGFLADLISRPVLAGFLSGVGVSLIIGKLPDVLGISVSGSTWDKLVGTVTNLDQVNVTSALLGLGVVLVMVGALRLPAGVPAALVALVIFSVIAAVIDAGAKGVSYVGALPAGLPSITVPSMSAGEVASLAGTAASIALVVLAQSAAVARSYANKNKYPDEVNADLLGLSAANAGSALTGGFAINGSPPRTAAGDSAGSRSQMVNIVMALVIALILLFASGLFAYIPSTVLDGIVLGIGIHLLKIADLRAVLRARPTEFWIALVTLVVVAFVGVEQGILLAILASVLDRARRAYEPSEETPIAAGVVSARAAERMPDVAPDALAGVLAYRFGASLFFANATRFDERVRELVATADPAVHTLVVDAGAMSDIDVTGADVLRDLAVDLAAQGCRTVVTDLSTDAAAVLERAGVDRVVTVLPHVEDVLHHVAAPTAEADVAPSVPPHERT